MFLPDMSKPSVSIPKQPNRKPAEDFYRLRREGIGFIEEMGSRLWTDYNSHDPGITILEALCYAITDLAYRIGRDIKDILAPPAPSNAPNQPFPNQPFFTARDILTVNPLTPDDFRRLLIDLDEVRNAWVVCKQCTCETGYYAWCENDQLQLAHQPPDDPSLGFEKVSPHGLYDVLLELEADPELGDLNDRKIERQTLLLEYLSNEGKPHVLKMELRFPDWGSSREDLQLFLSLQDDFTVKVSKLGLGKSNDFSEEIEEIKCNELLSKHWGKVFYVNFEISSNGKKINIYHTALRIFGDAFVRKKTEDTDNGGLIRTIRTILKDTTTTGVLRPYQDKLRRVDKAIIAAKNVLHQHRNLDEDYCCIRVVDVEDVAVCADVELTPDADIERVQARIWFEIEQYFNPPVPFYSLQELMAAEVPVEDIFNGPQLNNGFIKADELEAADLKNVLRTSDIINRLMDIDGVIAVNNLLLSHYDAEGKVIKGRVDPTWHDGTPVFTTDKSSAEWMLFISPLHQPRLYHNQSRFLFFKNGLPFKARMDEAQDTLIQLRGATERPKISNAENDLTVPTRTYRDINEYFPVQYSLPTAYGISPEGLPAQASSSRQAQAKQLKAYLMAFEQILGNAFAQLAHTADLFSLDLEQKHTYFVRQFSEEIIKGYGEIINDLDLGNIEGMTETQSEFLRRRNRFLDHIIARFGEQFSEYALMLTNREGKQIALEQLIKDKIDFLKVYPQISGERARAFDYTENPCTPDNHAMIKNRISLLLGSPEEISERAIIVEHLLLRPKFPGDALYPACSDGTCKICGDEDPYSFRLTFVMPGWTEPYNNDMAMRAFAERTIRRETPSHLLGKICWVSEEQLTAFQDAWTQWLEVNARFDWTKEHIQKEVKSFLANNLRSSEDNKAEKIDLSQCACTVVAQYGQEFHNWMKREINKGKGLEKIIIEEDTIPQPTLCSERFKDDTADQLNNRLWKRYRKYVEVSYRLHTVVKLLSELNSIYPTATLHDCDEGSDQNPVRLGKTVLGNIKGDN